MQTSFILTEELIRKAVWRVWARRFRLPFILATIACLVCCLTLQDASKTGFVLCLWLGVAVGFVAVYLRWLSQARSKLRLMNDPSVEVTITADEFRWRSCLGDSRLAWRVFETVWQFSDTWLLFFGRASHIVLPTDAITNIDRELICSKVRENGGRVL